MYVIKNLDLLNEKTGKLPARKIVSKKEPDRS
jgi:hypothetical protein